MQRLRLIAALIILAAMGAAASEIHPPAQVAAGSAITIPTSGSGEATFYLIGPSSVMKSKVQRASDISIDSDKL